MSNSSTRPKTELECFLLMDVPVSSLVEGQSILGMTNASILADPHRRGSDLSKLVLYARVTFPPFIFTASCVQCRGQMVQNDWRFTCSQFRTCARCIRKYVEQRGKTRHDHPASEFWGKIRSVLEQVAYNNMNPYHSAL